MSEALEAAVREFNLSLPAWAPFKRWGDLSLLSLLNSSINCIALKCY